MTVGKKTPTTTPVRDLRDFYPEQQKEVSHEADKHVHEWHFVREYHLDIPVMLKSKFACLCGAVKRVKQFEVEE